MPVITIFITQSLRSIGLIKAQSVRNISHVINNLVVDKKFDILIITETWLSNSDQSIIGELIPNGYAFRHKFRENRKGGGICVICRNSIKLVMIERDTTSFESLEFTAIIDNHTSFHILGLYRPPDSNKTLFLDELSDIIVDIALKPQEPLILGDFNLHLENNSKNEIATFMETINSFGLTVNIKIPTHLKGHTIDNVINKKNTALNFEFSVNDIALSDHFLIEIEVECNKPLNKKKSICYRKTKNIDYEKLNSDFESAYNELKNDSHIDTAFTTYHKKVS